MPGRTTSNRFYYVYVLRSMADNNRYIGFTTDLVKRVREHNSGTSFATVPRRPLELVCWTFIRVIRSCTNRV